MEVKPRVCFEVEKIIGVSSDGNYHVQWAPSWVNKFHLVGCEDLIQQFLQQQTVAKQRLGETSLLEVQTEVNVVHSRQPQVLLSHQPQVLLSHQPQALLSHQPQADRTDLNTVYSHQPESNLADRDTIPSYQPELDQSGIIDSDAVSELRGSEYENEIILQDDDKSFSLVGGPLCSVSEITAEARSNQEGNILTVEHSADELLDNVVVKVEEPETVVADLDASTVSMVCGNRFSNFSNVEIHSGTSDGDDSHEITMPHERTHIRSHGLSPHRHTKSRKKHVCHVCNRAFGSTGHLRDHVMTHTGVRPFSCEYCKQGFIQKTHLKRHILRFHMGGHSTVDQHLPSPVLQEDAVICDNIMTVDKSEDPKKKYKCYLCERRFRSSGHLKDHVRTHTGIKPFSCDFCEERFIQKSNLKKHVRRYHPEPQKVESAPSEETSKVENNELTGTHGEASMVVGPS